MKRIEVKFSCGMSVIIPKTSFSEINCYRQNVNMNETGGAIVGFLTTNFSIILSDFMKPSKRNKSGKYWLNRSKEDAQKFVYTKYFSSNGKKNYFGEWHTHPVKLLRTSEFDRQQLADLLNTSKIEIPFLIGVILGNTGTLCIWYQDVDARFESINVKTCSIIKC